MLFAPRIEKEYSIEAHAELCISVLEIFLNTGRQIGARYTQETWEHLLKILLGTADIVLKVIHIVIHRNDIQKGVRGANADEGNPSLGTRLAPLFLKVNHPTSESSSSIRFYSNSGIAAPPKTNTYGITSKNSSKAGDFVVPLSTNGPLLSKASPLVSFAYYTVQKKVPIQSSYATPRKTKPIPHIYNLSL